MSAGVSLEVSQTSEIRDGQLSGKTVVVTGTLESFTRQEAEVAIQKAGGRSSSSVSKNTDYVVACNEAGSKLAKAEKLGITVLNNDQFKELLELE